MDAAVKIDLGPFKEFVEGNGYRNLEVMPDGRYACIMPLMFTHAIIVGDIAGAGPDDRWCYGNLEAAIIWLIRWKVDGFVGEPQGWHRHPFSGRRREGGDKEKEIIAP